MKNLISFLLLAVIMLSSIPLQAENKPNIIHNGDIDYSMNQDDWMLLGSNMLINGIAAGLGAVEIKNIPWRRAWKSRIFWHSFYQGLLGGGIIYSGKRVIGFGNETNRFPIAGGKLLHDWGTAVVYSAALGENYLNNPRYMTDVGPFVLFWEQKNGLNPEVYFWPNSAYNVYRFISTGAKFDFAYSCSTLTPVFWVDSQYYLDNGEDDLQGLHRLNYISLNIDGRGDSSIAHEVIHTRQFFSILAFDPYVRNKTKNFLKSSSLINREYQYNLDYRLGYADYSSLDQIMLQNVKKRNSDLAEIYDKKVIETIFSSKILFCSDMAILLFNEWDESFPYEERFTEFETFTFTRRTEEYRKVKHPFY